MKQNDYIAGVAMTPFGKHLDHSFKSLLGEAVEGALTDAGLDKQARQAAWVGNVAAGVISVQVCVPGQVALRDIGIGRIPVIDVMRRLASARSTSEVEAPSSF